MFSSVSNGIHSQSPKRNSKTNENKRLKRDQKRSKMRVNTAGES